jgi:hypothetical protein
MANTKKVEKMAVFRLEKGKLTTGEVWQYGGSTITTFTGAIAIPYTDVEVGGMKTVFEDESVESHAFKSDSVKAMLGADLGGLQGNMKYIAWIAFNTGRSDMKTVEAPLRIWATAFIRMCLNLISTTAISRHIVQPNKQPVTIMQTTVKTALPYSV